jgi:hypothetical protein
MLSWEERVRMTAMPARAAWLRSSALCADASEWSTTLLMVLERPTCEKDGPRLFTSPSGWGESVTERLSVMPACLVPSLPLTRR